MEARLLPTAQAIGLPCHPHPVIHGLVPWTGRGTVPLQVSGTSLPLRRRGSADDGVGQESKRRTDGINPGS